MGLRKLRRQAERRKVPGDLLADYRRIDDAYRKMIEALPGEMRL